MDGGGQRHTCMAENIKDYKLDIHDWEPGQGLAE